MSATQLGETIVALSGALPDNGQALPDGTITLPDLTDVSLSEYASGLLVLNIFPSVDTPVCAASVRRFNEIAAQVDAATVLNISADLPFACGRFGGAEEIAGVTMGSVFRSDLGDQLGVRMTDGPMRGLLARCVIVARDGIVEYSEMVPQIGQEPDYNAALEAMGA